MKTEDEILKIYNFIKIFTIRNINEPNFYTRLYDILEDANLSYQNTLYIKKNFYELKMPDLDIFIEGYIAKKYKHQHQTNISNIKKSRSF